MSLFQVLMIAGVIPAVVAWLLHFLSEKGLEEEGCVYMPKGFLLVGLFCGLLCIVLTVCSELLKLGITWQVLQISSAVLTLVCLLAYCSLNIRYDCETFQCRTFFFQKRYRYSDIRGVVFGASESYTLVMTKGKVHIDGMTIGGQQFLDYADERCRKIGLGTIPEIQSQIFHGNVVEPLPKIILVCLPGSCLTVLAAWCLTEWCSIRIPENLQEEKMMLSFSGKQEEFLYFASKGRKLQIDENAVGSYDELESAISQNRELDIIYDRIDEESLKIWGISDSNTVYVSPQMVYTAEVKSGREGVFICCAAAVGYWLFAAFFCYILDHAEKYPRIAMLLVKKEDLNI